MTGMILSAARSNVRRLLDDNGQNKRYSDTAIDEALQAAISSCVSDYATGGGDAFDEEVTVVTSSAGLGTITGHTMLVRTVQVSNGSSMYTLEPQQRSDRRQLDQTARTLLVEIVREFQLPTTTTHPLIGVGATTSNTWMAFDQWVCSNAALLIGITDNDKRPGLERLEARFRASALKRDNNPSSFPLPDSEAYSLGYDGWWQRVGYVYSPSQTASTIQLVARDSAWL